LHDSHAEILALRAFNYWLIRECRSVLAWEEQCRQNQHQNPGLDCTSIIPEVADYREDNTYASPFVKRRPNDSTASLQKNREQREKSITASIAWPPFELRDEIRVYMYCTCAPCGDASMELCMAAQDDPTPWKLPAGRTATDNGDKPRTSSEILLDGRAHFSVLGVVRRKPSRADAEPTLSKSCSDKLALKQITSLLSFPTSLLVAPTRSVYLAGLILPEDQISRVGCERAFGGGENGRLKSVSSRVWNDRSGLSYQYMPFTVKSIPAEEVEAQWAFGKPKDTSSSSINEITEASTKSKTKKRTKPGNVSAVWISPISHPPSLCPTRSNESLPFQTSKASQTATCVNETLLNGVKQGYHFSSLTSRKASVLSRARMWELLRETILELNQCSMAEVTDSSEEGVSKSIKTPTVETPLDHVLTSLTYGDLKRGFLNTRPEGMLREQVSQETKDIMGAWIRNRGDERWGMEVLIPKDKVGRGRAT
jgi:tRNA-specific adenosine deaminase 1